ncbi:unnamed protein product [Linum tenue]|uniref:Leucine-rich repeat-containing N-terminal plant-type domain-containing protein n=1 Tax=Linum tenue TaxID=586396 RepID=A0AAV0HI03_9ROSI|nr:unnamed protein product [Linum tenue]
MLPPSISCPDDQKQALLQFQSLAAGNTTSKFLPWISSTDCCEWQGVECAADALSGCGWQGGAECQTLPRSPTQPRVVTALNLFSFIPLLQSSGQVTLVSANVLTPLFGITTVKKLDLSLNLIHGEIPGRGIANLTQLVTLDLSNNYFTGSIPAQLFSLTQLESLRINIVDDVQRTVNNNGGPFEGRKGYTLEGEIPVEIGKLTNLKELLLDGNRLSGSIPSTVSQLKSLEEFDLHGNFLSGEIPTGIGNCSNLTTFAVWDNSLAGDIPMSVLNLTKIRTFRLNGNLLTGEVPAGLFDLPELSYLYLGDNRLTLRGLSSLIPRSRFISLSLPSCNISDSIPRWVANQTTLYSLDLSQNRIHGAFPQWLVDTQLQSLDLSDNDLEGSLPADFFQPKGGGQSIINLSRNNLRGRLPETAICENAFNAIVLSGNQFSGPLPKCMSNLTSLSVLDLSGNAFAGEVLPLLFQEGGFCPTYVDLSSNRFHGRVSVNCSQNLQFLVLGRNNFSGHLPQSLGEVTGLKFLDLHENNITGEIPSSISRLSNLQVLGLRGNSLEGQIPRSLSNLTSIQILDLSGNQLSGSLPEGIGNLTAMSETPRDSSIQVMASGTENYFFVFGVLLDSPPLLQVFWKTLHRGLPNQHLGLYTFLDLSNNRFSGEIPSELGNLTSLKALNLSHNQLSGWIPASLGEMRSLESLDLSHNGLSGEIPQSFEKFQQLNNLDVSNNDLTGRIPTGPQMDRMNDPGSYANNSAGLCGAQIRVPCDGGGLNGSPPATEEEEGSERETEWFSWMTAGIGFPAGFVTTVVGMYGLGYFHAGLLWARWRRRWPRGIRF